MSAHTPGPWTVNEDFHVYGPQKCPTTICATIYKKEDALLIASAPELLEALRGLLDDIIDYSRINNLNAENNHWLVVAREAIAKAEGREVAE